MAGFCWDERLHKLQKRKTYAAASIAKHGAKLLGD